MKEVQNELKEILLGFADGKIKRINVYVEGVCGLFVSRSTDGMIMGYIDPSLREAEDDHLTSIINPDFTLRSFHRQIADKNASYYLYGEATYLKSTYGLHKLLQDMQSAANVPFYMKSLQLLMYNALRWAESTGFESIKGIEVLAEPVARNMGLKSPCIIIRTSASKRLGLTLIVNLLRLQYAIMKQTRRDLNSRHRPRDIPGSRMVIRKRKQSQSL